MSVGFVSSDPLDNLTNLYQRPIFIQAARNPTVNDLQPAGTQWGNGATPGQVIYETNGAGLWSPIVGAGGSGITSITGNTGVAVNTAAINLQGTALGAIVFNGASASQLNAQVQVDGSTITINGTNQLVSSPSFIPWADRAAGILPVNTGSFATANGTYTLPAAPTVGQVVEVINQAGGAPGVVVQANAGQRIRNGTVLGAVAGSATSVVLGDSVSLVYRATGAVWIFNDSIGSWSVA